MSDTTAAFTVTIPPGTTEPTQFQCPLGLSTVDTILISVPAGCAGNVGFQIWAGGSTAYPVEDTQYFIFDDYVFTQSVSNQIDTGQWAINAYNNDQFPHTLQVYFMFDYVQYSPSTAVGSPVSL